MTQQEQMNLACELSSLSVFRGILKHKTMQAFLGFLNAEESTQKRLDMLGEFVCSLSLEDNCCFSDFLCRVVFADENPYIVGSAQKADIPAVLRENAAAELELFSRLSRLGCRELSAPLNFSGYIPQFDNKPIDFIKAYAERLDNVGRYGYGIFSAAKMFRVHNDEIVPVKTADTISPLDFVGYESERGKVFDNTKALIDGRPAANILLFGDAGTGKSSTVKACVNHFSNSGVRLVELRKDQLFSLPHVMERVSSNPLKFIIFIDDLSFEKNDECFSMLKAVLEGSASAKAKNAAIYATSNRRHIVKERFSDRSSSDDLHRNDTVQELMSLSDRFGLTVYFEKPNKILYLDIVHKLADKKGITLPQNELDIKAEAFALGKGSRSPRAAEQFINSLL